MNTYCEYIRLKKLYKLFFFKNAYRDKKKSFYGETAHFREKLYKDDPPFYGHFTHKGPFWNTYCTYTGLKKLYKLFFIENAFWNPKSRFTAERRILEKNVTSTTPPFMAILPTGDLFGTPTVDILGWKSEFRIFWVADHASGQKFSFLVVGGGFFWR